MLTKSTGVRRFYKILSVALTVAMLIGLLPSGVFATDETSDMQIEKTGNSINYYTGTTTDPRALTTKTTAQPARINDPAGSDAYFEISKEISGTETENLFDITLTVTSKNDVSRIEIPEDAAVLMVLDVSDSMHCTIEPNSTGTSYPVGTGKYPANVNEKTRMQAMKESVQTFIGNYAESAGSSAGQTPKRLLSLVTFSQNADLVKINNATWADVAVSANKTAAETAVGGGQTARNASSGGFDYQNNSGFPIGTTATNIEAGLQLAYNIVKAHQTSATDFNGTYHVILLTDGDPNYVVNRTGNYTGTERITSVSSQSNMDTARSSAAKVASQPNYAGGQNSKPLRDYATIHTVAFSTSNGNWLQGSIRSGAGTHSDASGNSLNLSFNTIAETIYRMANAYTVFDPMGKYIVLDEDSFDRKGNAVEIGDQIDGDNTVRRIVWNVRGSDIVNTDRHEGDPFTYRLTYQIRLDVFEIAKANESFDAYWLTNGATEFLYYFSDEAPGVNPDVETAYFRVPKVKPFKADLEFTKVDAFSGDPIQGAKFQLQAIGGVWPVDSEGMAVSVESGSDGKVSFTGIPSGHTYTLVETAAGEAPENLAYDTDSVNENDYSVEVTWATATLYKGDTAVTNKKVENDYELTKVTKTVKKIWKDPENSDRPDVYAVLYGVKQDDTEEKLAGPEKLTGTGSEWTYEFENIPAVYSSNEKYVPYKNYLVKETDDQGKAYTNEPGATLTGYSVSIDQKNLTITNTRANSSKSVEVSKNWKNANGNDWPSDVDKIAVTLTRQAYNGTAYVDDISFTPPTPEPEFLTKTNSSVTFSGLDEFDESGLPYIYIASDNIDGYDKATGSDAEQTGNSTTITLLNKQTLPANAKITGSKIWRDNGNKYQTRPDTLYVQLYQDTAMVEEITLSDDNEIEESPNTWQIKSANEYPLYYEKEGTYVAYTYTFKELDGETVLANGDLLPAVGGDKYTVSYSEDGRTITNTLTGTTDLAFTKVWEDGANYHPARPGQIKVNLYAGGNFVKSQNFNLTDDMKFLDLAKYNSNGALIAYTVDDNVSGYKIVEYDSETKTLTNTFTSISGIKIKKIWLDNEDELQQRPGSIKVNIYDTYGNENTTASSITLSGDSWQTIVNLPTERLVSNAVIDDEGNEITPARYETIKYDVSEDSVPDGYKSDDIATIDKDGTYVLTNVRTGKFNLTVNKTWIDSDNEFETRPDDAVFNLYRSDDDENPIATESVPTESPYSIKFSGLEIFDEGGALYGYTVKEVLSDNTYTVDGATKSVTVPTDGGNATLSFTNKLNQAKTSFQITKNWVTDGEKPSNIRVRLYADGVAETDSEGDAVIHEVSLTNGQGSIDDLNKYKITGEGTATSYSEISYTVKEVDDDGNVIENGGKATVSGSGYTVTYSEDTHVITNTAPIKYTNLRIVKLWNAPEGTTHPVVSFTVWQIPDNGSEKTAYDTITLGGNAKTYEEYAYPENTLPLYNDNFTVKYSYEAEENLPDDSGYELFGTATANGVYTFTNQIKAADVTVSGTKTWNTLGKADAELPGSITVALYHENGSRVDGIAPQTLSAPDWTYNFTITDGKYASTGQYASYVVKEVTEGEDGDLIPLEENGSVFFGDYQYRVHYTTERTEDGNITTDIENALQDGYYFSVRTYYRTVTDGVAGDWEPVDGLVQYALEKGSAGQTVTLADVNGLSASDAAALPTSVEWTSYGTNSDYALYSSTDNVTLTEGEVGEGYANTTHILKYYYQRTVTTSYGGGGGGAGTPPPIVEEEIEDEATPLADMVLPELDDDEVFILDEDTPLADLPQTGATVPAAGSGATQGAGGANAVLPTKGRRDDDRGATV